jgi:hypothetical protein
VKQLATDMDTHMNLVKSREEVHLAEPGHVAHPQNRGLSECLFSSAADLGSFVT